MIRYQLNCTNGHEFDAWFRSSGDYDQQAGSQMVACPYCASTKVEKSLMAPSVSTARAKEARAERDNRSALESGAVSENDRPSGRAVALANAPAAPAHVPPPEFFEALRRVRDYVKANAENVGSKFAEEARKIHYEEVEPRGIYGTASAKEAHDLEAEGISVLPLPELPEDKN